MGDTRTTQAFTAQVSSAGHSRHWLCRLEYRTFSRIRELEGCTGKRLSLCYLSWSQWRGMRQLIWAFKKPHNKNKNLTHGSISPHAPRPIKALDFVLLPFQQTTRLCSLNTTVSGSFIDWCFWGLSSTRVYNADRRRAPCCSCWQRLPFENNWGEDKQRGADVTRPDWIWENLYSAEWQTALSLEKAFRFAAPSPGISCRINEH